MSKKEAQVETCAINKLLVGKPFELVFYHSVPEMKLHFLRRYNSKSKYSKKYNNMKTGDKVWRFDARTQTIECGELRFKRLDMADCECPELPEDAITFEDAEDIGPTLPDLSAPAEIIAMLREAKEKHSPVMFTNDDKTRALLIKDANDLNLKITVNGVPFEEI